MRPVASALAAPAEGGMARVGPRLEGAVEAPKALEPAGGGRPAGLADQCVLSHSRAARWASAISATDISAAICWRW